MGSALTPGLFKSCLLASLALLAASPACVATDTYDGKTLTMPSVVSGAARFTNMAVSVGKIVGQPSGTVPNGSVDLYDPATNQLTIPAVTVGSKPYDNVVIDVGSLISVQGVSGADTYDGANLHVPYVKVGGIVYADVVLAVSTSRVVHVAGGMPAALFDQYDPAGHLLLIPAVAMPGGKVYTNVTLAATTSDIVSVGIGDRVPGVVGYTQAAASALITAVGLSVGAINTQASYSAPAGVVISESPPALTQLAAGSPVNLLVSSGPPPVTESVLYSFTGGQGTSQDAWKPQYGLLQATDGNFYGVGDGGSASGNGAVYRITASGTESLLYSFGTSGAKDGVYPDDLIQSKDGNFYGTTELGGAYGHGTLFRLTPGGGETVLWSFGGGTDGAQPNGLIEGADGNFYGTTYNGGQYNEGTVFVVTPGGNETVLHSFSGNALSGSLDGVSPRNNLVQGTDGSFYGTTSGPTSNALGTIFNITTGGLLTTLHQFTGGDDGATPQATLIQGSDGRFYGTTVAGGAPNRGTVFRITPGGTLTTLHTFTGETGGSGSTDGAVCTASLVQGMDGNFYGVTQQGGGTYNAGTVFMVTPTGVETVLYSFNGGGSGLSGSTDGAGPSGLILGADGNFYGTTSLGGAVNSGTLFALKRANLAP